jgi:uncharacterized membrane protein
VPPVLVIYPELAPVIALTMIPLMASWSSLFVAPTVYVMVIVVAVTLIVAAVMLFPLKYVTDPIDAWNSKLVGAVNTNVTFDCFENSPFELSSIIISPRAL